MYILRISDEKDEGKKEEDNTAADKKEVKKLVPEKKPPRRGSTQPAQRQVIFLPRTKDIINKMSPKL